MGVQSQTASGLPTLAQSFRDAGYQAYAVGKLHVSPQRSRIGFDDVILNEEGRNRSALTDDYEQFLIDRGYAGQQFGHGMSNNEYSWRPWHLPEDCHVTNWATQQMCRTIKRRDPTRPAFWYLSHTHPHPPVSPLRDYLAMYDGVEIDDPVRGEWSSSDERVPYALRALAERRRPAGLDARGIRMVRWAFYALCTHIDHQLRVVVGTLREEGLLDNTMICFSADHGDMLGDHGLWAKTMFYEGSANVPMILSAPATDERVPVRHVDNRLVGLQDVMPTLLDLAGLAIPANVEGLSMVGEPKRPHLYGEHGDGTQAKRMMHDGEFKLIYYPVGNRTQLFDLREDPAERHDLSDSPDHTEVRGRLQELLADELSGSDKEWLVDGKLGGLPEQVYVARPDRSLANQRGIH